MQVDAGLFIETLRDGLEQLTDDNVDYTAGDILALFDRASVKALVGSRGNGSARQELTPQQRGARTRAKNRAAKAKEHDFGGGTQFNPPAEAS